jgi:light-regulated signal transduction histidine kinase (bacteriophytochrome)
VLQFAEWLQATRLSLALRLAEWSIPVLQSIHILMIGIVFVSVLVVALRVLGRLRTDQPLADVVARFTPWLWGGLVIMLLTGALLAIAEPIRQVMTLSFLSTVDADALVKALVDERPELSLPRAEVRIESPLLPVVAHEATLSQCLTNLLSNAVKFVERGVVPRVRVWTEELKTSTVRPMVRLWVEDEGIGIAAKDRERIFEIFQRLNSSPHYEGSGIGLAIVRKAAERMGGRCGVDLETRNGTRFWLELPKA